MPTNFELTHEEIACYKCLCRVQRPMFYLCIHLSCKPAAYGKTPFLYAVSQADGVATLPCSFICWIELKADLSAVLASAKKSYNRPPNSSWPAVANMVRAGLCVPCIIQVMCMPEGFSSQPWSQTLRRAGIQAGAELRIAGARILQSLYNGKSQASCSSPTFSRHLCRR